MPKLLIDAGNTRIKAGLFEDQTLLKTWELDQTDLLKEMEDTMEFNKVSRVFISDVGGRLEKLFQGNINGLPIEFLNAQTALPFKNSYESKHSLGSDRLALVAGALHFFSGETCLVMDAGTCVTYDLIHASQEYLGGNISPGLQMRLKAMNSFTGKLPLPEFRMPDGLIGKNTEQCLLGGTYFGLVGEMEYFIKQYQIMYPGIKLLLTGGDAEVLAKTIKTSIFAEEHLLLYGLNKILHHNAD